ncbi:transcription initiation factor TFIID subunit 4 isoform X1 [Oncorhynchus keta]|uniref:transcription initiation factor TFIID subunit 4 isoform X1 n=1 Tax=Oncorhynchus keta TaxID=8018 RepID=UPI00227AA557|nr:transcription initiation factor TFIID subunit 4 isoform X1 [Oncorhynchus keta]
MAGTSDPLEDMLFSEVDEKAVSDLVGSLESQLVGQSNPANTQSENRGAGTTVTANHHLGKTLPAQVGNVTTLVQQQQQEGQHKAGMHQEMNSNEISSEKTVTSSSLSSIPSFEEASTTSGTGVNATKSGLQSHGTSSITTLPASGGVTTSPLVNSSSIIIISSTTTRGSALASGQTSTDSADHPRKRITASLRSASAGIQSLNGTGGAVTSRNNPPAAGTDALINNISTVSSSASAANSSRTVDVTSCVNTTNFTLSSSSISSTQSAIPLDKGTPTIALQRLPSHIVASIAQNGNGTTVSALVKQGAIGPITSAAASQVNHKKEGSEAKSDAPVQSKIAMSSPLGVVNSVINSVSSPSAVFNLAATSTASLVMAKPAVNVVGQTTTVGVVRSPSVATATQPLLQPGVQAAQRIVAPQLIVRPPQQPQTTIQLPPGFTIPPGMVLVRTEMGQLVMVPQQALAQAHAQAQTQAQNNISPRTATPTAGATFRATTLQSVTSQAIRPCPPPVQAKMVLSPTPSPVLQISSSPAPPSKGPMAPVVAVTAPQQAPVVMAPQAQVQAGAQAASQPALPQQTSAPVAPGASVISQEMQENVKKCKNFLATLIKLASHNSPSPETSKNVKSLVQDLLDAKIEPEEFTNRLQSELKSSPQPYLVPFLKKSLPALRLSLLNIQHSLIQPLPQAKATPTTGTSSAIMAVPAVRGRLPNSVSTTGASVGAQGHTAALGIKQAGTSGCQVRMPMLITPLRTQGTVSKGATFQAGKSPVGFAVKGSGNQKNKQNDPGGGSFRDDDDINDVASMAGVNLNEESARILATNSELVGTHIRSCKDEAFLHPGLLHRRILETAKKFGVSDVPMEAVNFISHATQSRLRTVLEKVSSIAQHRMDGGKDEEWFEQSADVRSQLKFFEQLERIEKQRKDEQEREILLKAAKSRSRQEDPEQARLKQKAKEMQQQEMALVRQRDANLTALAAIGPRKKRKMDSPGATPSGTEVSGSSVGSPGASSSPSTSSQRQRQRITRVNLRDFIFYMEQERETAHSLLLYRALLK